MEIRGLAGAGIPGKVVRLDSFVTALVAVCADRQSGLQPILREEQLQEGQRDLIKQLPSVFSTLAAEGKSSNGITQDLPGRETGAAAPTQVQAAVGIPFKIEIPLPPFFGAEEKFHATVLADRGEGIGMLGTNVRFYTTLVDI